MSVEVAAAAASPTPSFKRPHPDNDDNIEIATPIQSRQSSPSPASTALSSPADVKTPKDTPLASTNPTSIDGSPLKHVVTTQISGLFTGTPQSSDAPPTKRRKLTVQEKNELAAVKATRLQEKEAARQAKEEEKRRKAEEREAEKRAKEQKAAAEKQAKDDEKRAKEEKAAAERKAKEEEKKAKQAIKDEERKKRDAEQAEKEARRREKQQEEERKNAKQKRLSSFFTIPKTTSPAAPLPKKLNASASPSKANFMTKDDARRRSMSLEPVDFNPPTPTKAKPMTDINVQGKQSDKGFLPFVLQKNMRLAPANAFLPKEADDATKNLVRPQLDSRNLVLDCLVGQPDSDPQPTLLQQFTAVKVQRGWQPQKVAKVVQKLQGSQNQPIDLTDDKPMDVLRSIPVKFFFYGEDVRPPYRGTWTREVNRRTCRKLALQPLARELPDIDYDYDSEAEWVEEEEGEDIENEDGEEEEEDDEENDGFIDDDNAPQYLARRGQAAPIEMEPICSGLQWEDGQGRMRSADPAYSDANFKDFEICFLLDPSPDTIDPFTTAYWEAEPVAPKQMLGQLPLTSSMGPPRQPLSDRTNGQATVQSTLVNGKTPKATKIGPRLVPADVLPAFTKEIDGSDLTKIALVEHLKKQFPKLNKAQITETLNVVAERVGAKQADKKWRLLNDAKV